jgi:hypothetical protein
MIAYRGIFRVAQNLLTSVGLGVNVTIVFFEFSVPIFMFATAVEVARLYRLRIMEFLIANRTRPVALHRTAK